MPSNRPAITPRIPTADWQPPEPRLPNGGLGTEGARTALSAELFPGHRWVQGPGRRLACNV